MKDDPPTSLSKNFKSSSFAFSEFIFGGVLDSELSNASSVGEAFLFKLKSMR